MTGDDFQVGDKVCYQPDYYPRDRWENGIVKMIPENDPQSIFVVYNCGRDWENYRNYTAAMTAKKDLLKGWKHQNI